MKPPVRVWVVLHENGYPITVETTRDKAESAAWDNDTIHRYRLDTPKRVPPSRLPVAGGVVRKKRKAKRGRR